MNLLVWQLIDSAFPSGGFAHSAGLEASMQHGHVTGGGGLRAFARQAIAQCGRSALPLVTAAHLRPEDFAELDRLTDVFLSNPVANRASRAQGRALLTSVARAFPDSPAASLEAGLRADGLTGHHAPVFGCLFRALGVNLDEAQHAFLFIAARGVSSAAIRLGIVGPYEAQAMQAALAPLVDEVIRDCGGLAPHEIAHTAPLVDLFQSTHDRLYSRLFQS